MSIEPRNVVHNKKYRVMWSEDYKTIHLNSLPQSGNLGMASGEVDFEYQTDNLDELIVLISETYNRSLK
jgi:hypothetical protein